jgi:large subunit ribosomal protein L33
MAKKARPLVGLFFVRSQAARPAVGPVFEPDYTEVYPCDGWGAWLVLTVSPNSIMQDLITLECTEARKEGKPVSRYLSTRNKKTVTERIEKKKYNPHLKRHTLHKEIK